jgi:hypothetical protein
MNPNPNPSPNPDFDRFLEQMKQQYASQLSQMPLPEGVPEHVRALIEQGDVDSVLFLLKLSWVLGAQAGANAKIEQLEQSQNMPVSRAKA